MDKLTIKQENFAQKYVELGNASEAYRQSYNAENMTDKSINEVACRTLAEVKIASRVVELQSEAAERNEVTVDSLVKELEEAREIAKKENQTSSMVSATMGKGKLMGFDSTNVNHKGDFTLNVVTGINAAPNSRTDG